MQCRSAFYAIGGMIPSLVLQHTGSVSAAVAICSLLCVSTCVGGSIERLVGITSWGRTLGVLHREGDFNEKVTETTSLLPKTGGDHACHVANIHPSDRKLESTELVVLEELLAGNGQSNGCSDDVEMVVQSVLSKINEENAASTKLDAYRSEELKDVTLAFASAHIVDSLAHPSRTTDEKHMDVAAELSHQQIISDITASIALIPEDAKNILTLFIFLFCTFSASFVGWFPTFCAVKIDEGADISVGLAAKTVSIYFLFMSWGCIASIPFTIWVPNRTLLRFHLILITIGVVVFQISVTSEVLVYALYAASAIMGYGVSSIFPLTMTMANDYGFTA